MIGTATREGKRWLYLDAGVYGGLGELSNEFRFTIHTDRSGPDIPWTVAGPTCDGLDVCLTDQGLPESLQAGDFFYVHDHGAYATACATTFNGFPIPNILATVNAFHLGARSVNPNVTTRVVFNNAWVDPSKEAAATNALGYQGVDVVTMIVDSPITVVQTAERRGMYSIGFHSLTLK